MRSGATEKKLANLANELKVILNSVEIDVHYLVLKKMNKKSGPREIIKDHWKILAIILNRYVGILLILITIMVITFCTGIEIHSRKKDCKRKKDGTSSSNSNFGLKLPLVSDFHSKK